MADDLALLPSAAPVLPPAVATAAPQDAPVAAPLTEAPAANLPVVAEPAVAPAVVEAAPSAPAISAEPHPSEIPTLLERLGKDAPAVAEAPKPLAVVAEALPLAEHAPDYKFDNFRLPEPLRSTQPAELAELTGLLAPIRAPVEVGQQLLDLHAAKMQAYAEHLTREQIRVFNGTVRGWEAEAMADPQIGGAGFQTAQSAIARMRDMLVSSAPYGSDQRAADMAAFETFLRVTGAGSHPAFLRLLHNAARYFDEPQLNMPANPMPPKDIGRAPRGNGMAAIYKQPI